MNTSPLVSVIVPNYNYAKYLNARIDSILNQTFQDFELILLDDCSTDNSREIIETYRNNAHVKHIVFNEKNTGSPFVQWQKGISLAQGKYVWIAEADDLAHQNFLETCVRLCESGSDVSICFTGSKLIDSNDKILKKDVNHWGRRPSKKYARFDGKHYAQRNLYWKNYIINGSGVIFSREKAINVSPEFTKMRYCGDYLFWFEMSLKGEVIEIYDTLNYFRQHAQKATARSHNKGGGILEDITILEKIERALPQVSSYRKKLRRGLLYRKISRQRTTKEIKIGLYKELNIRLGGRLSHRIIQKMNKYARFIIPCLPSDKSDRL